MSFLEDLPVKNKIGMKVIVNKVFDEISQNEGIDNGLDSWIGFLFVWVKNKLFGNFLFVVFIFLNSSFQAIQVIKIKINVSFVGREKLKHFVSAIASGS
jgi:hypothetical protein